jgi:hypothetical protein
MKNYGAVPNWIILMILIPILFVWYIFLGSIYKIGKKIFFTENFDKCKIKRSKKLKKNKKKLPDLIRIYFDKLMMPIFSKKIPGFNNFPDHIKNKIITPSLIVFRNKIKKNNKLEKLNILFKDKSEKQKKLFFKKIFNMTDIIIS